VGSSKRQHLVIIELELPSSLSSSPSIVLPVTSDGDAAGSYANTLAFPNQAIEEAKLIK
jgi:hypothetical protein